MISFEVIIGGDDGHPDKDAKLKKALPAKLIDLKLLIQLEQEGFTGALKYYKQLHMLQVSSGGPGIPR